MGMKRYIGQLIYHFLGIHLPGSYSHFGVIGRKIRAFCGKMILDSCGTNVNIEEGAKFGSHISLGDN